MHYSFIFVEIIQTTMKKISGILLLFIFSNIYSQQVQYLDYKAYFSNNTMRVDYFHTGTAEEEHFSVDRILNDGNWSGSNINSYGIRGGFTGSFNPQYKRWQNFKMGQKG